MSNKDEELNDKELNVITFDIDEHLLKQSKAGGTIEKQFYGSGSGYYIGIKWSSSRAGTENASNVTATAYLRTQGSGYSFSSTADKDCYITINGVKKTGKTKVGMGTNTTKDLISNTVKVGHDSNGYKNCSFACYTYLGITLGNGTKLNSADCSASRELDKINLNSAPWWTSDDTRITCWGQTLKSHIVIPENTDHVLVTSSTAWDNEQGGSLHYDLHRYINGGYSEQIKWGQSGLDANDYLGRWGAGTKIKYEAKVHDGNGLWASGSRWSWEYTKNTFSRSTVGNVGSIGVGTSTLAFTAYSAKNQGGICTTNYGYRISSLTSGVTVYGNTEHISTTQNDISFVLGVKNNGGSPTNPHWLDANEIKNVVKNSNHCGNIRLRLTSWNDYGSSGTYDFDVWVDFRQNPAYTNIRYTSGTVSHGGSSYYIPAYIPIRLEWDAVSDPLGGTITYEVFYQRGDSNWVFLANTNTTRNYTANLASTIGNVNESNFRFIVKAKTSYGNSSESGGPRITLHRYSAPTVRVTEIIRNKDNASIKGTITINSSIPSITPNTTHYRLNNGSNVNYSHSGTTNPFTFNFTVPNLTSGSSYRIHVASSDTIKSALLSMGIEAGWDSTDNTIPIFTPSFCIRKKGIGVNAVPDGTANLIIGGITRIEKDSKPALHIRPTVNTEGQEGRIVFENVSKDQAVHLRYNHFDNTQAPFGLHLEKAESNTNNSSKPYLKVDGDLYSNGAKVITDNSNKIHFESEVNYSITLKDHSQHTWFRNAGSGVWTFQSGSSGDDWSKTVSLRLPTADNTNNNQWFELGQASSNATKGAYRGLWVTQYDNGKKDGDLYAKRGFFTGGIEVATGNSIDFVSSGDYSRIYNSAEGTSTYLILETGDDGDQDATIIRNRHWEQGNHNTAIFRRSCIDFNSDLNMYNRWIRCHGNEGIYFHSYGGGWNMQDTTWIRSYGGKSVYLDSGRLKTYNAVECRYIDAVDGRGLDISTNGNSTIFFNLHTASGVNLNLNRVWAGSKGSEPSFYNTTGAGWGFLGNSGWQFYRVYGSGGSVSDRNVKYSINKANIEEHYNNIKEINVYNYRTVSTKKDENNNIIERFNRQDLMLGCMVDELPTETVFYDNESGDGKSVDMYSYTTMILGALKQTIKKVEILENELEELKNGIIN